MMNEIIVVPIHQVKDMIQSAVKECVTEIMALANPAKDAESVDMDGAVKYLNANGVIGKFASTKIGKIE